MSSKLSKILFILGIIFVLSAFFLFWIYWQPSKNLEVDFLNVGQGDAILIKAPSGQNILIDGGPDKSVIRELSRNLAWWDREIDLIILTHPHDDHVSGLIDVIKRYKVKQIISSGVIHNGPNYLAWMDLVRNKKIKLVIIDRPQTVNLGQGCDLEIIYPISSFLGKEVDNLNNSSLVAKLIYGESEFLFMGDAEKETEDKLLAEKIDMSANVLKVGHHGSDTGSGENFLNTVKPKIAIIEVGKDNGFGHPSLRVLKRLERLGVKIFRTDTDGTIKFISDGIEIKIK